jgi:hypothetical protein
MSKYPNARDIREILVPEVVRTTGIELGVVRAAADAELFAIAAYANSGGTVLTASGHVQAPIGSRFADWMIGDEDDPMAIVASVGDDEPLSAVIEHLPFDVPLPRFLPVFEFELDELAVQLAAARDPGLDLSMFAHALDAWRATSNEFSFRAAVGLEDLSDVVIRRLWETSERAFEDWQMDNLDMLPELRPEVVRRQWRTPDGTIADVLCRIIESEVDGFHPRDLIVIENKAFEATTGAVEQLAGYVDHARRQYETDDVRVHGMLVALSIGDAVETAAEDAGFITLTWGEIGYLDHLWSPVGDTHAIRDFLESQPLPERV